MRIVLLLTFGFPVLAAQLVALATPHVEPVLCSNSRRAVPTASAATPRPLAALRVQLPAPVVATPAPDDSVRTPVPAPEGASARALTFVMHHRRQAT